jgi:hypothetical protein
MLSKEIRDNCDQLLILTERGIPALITDPVQMLTDTATRMYQVYDNTNVIKFSHKFSTTADRINKKSAQASEAVNANDLTYLKILCIGKNQTHDANGSAVAITAKDLQISFRVKMYNSYHDMKVLTGALSLNP